MLVERRAELENECVFSWIEHLLRHLIWGLSSVSDVAVVARFAAYFDGSGLLIDQPFFDFIAHGAALSSA